MKTKRKLKKYSIITSIYEVEDVMENELPQDGYAYKFVTEGGFSAISLIIYIADRTRIKDLYVSTFRVGKKELRFLDALKSEGRLENAHFVVGSVTNGENEISTKELFNEVFAHNNWRSVVLNNHSKILIFDTDAGKFVIETSSNLNENPKFEQFNIEKDDAVFEFYKGWFERWMSQS